MARLRRTQMSETGPQAVCLLSGSSTRRRTYGPKMGPKPSYHHSWRSFALVLRAQRWAHAKRHGRDAYTLEDESGVASLVVWTKV